MRDAATQPTEPKLVGDYLLIRRLGSGSMGEVWLGRHAVTEAFAAVKLLRQNVRSRDRIMKTFNVADLVSCAGSMLRASSEGTPSPTQVASTMMGSDEQR